MRTSFLGFLASSFFEPGSEREFASLEMEEKEEGLGGQEKELGRQDEEEEEAAAAAATDPQWPSSCT
jgi:hypothetical protein